MNRDEFIGMRKRLGKTQVQIARLLGTSLKAVHSYEQGWRSVPAHVERQMFFLVSRFRGEKKGQKPCWVLKKCPAVRKRQCPAWEFQAGKLCWFINGTICDGIIHEEWKDKMAICRGCEVFLPLLGQEEPEVRGQKSEVRDQRSEVRGQKLEP